MTATRVCSPIRALLVNGGNRDAKVGCKRLCPLAIDTPLFHSEAPWVPFYFCHLLSENLTKDSWRQPCLLHHSRTSPLETYRLCLLLSRREIRSAQIFNDGRHTPRTAYPRTLIFRLVLRIGRGPGPTFSPSSTQAFHTLLSEISHTRRFIRFITVLFLLVHPVYRLRLVNIGVCRTLRRHGTVPVVNGQLGRGVPTVAMDISSCRQCLLAMVPLIVRMKTYIAR